MKEHPSQSLSSFTKNKYSLLYINIEYLLSVKDMNEGEGLKRGILHRGFHRGEGAFCEGVKDLLSNLV